MTSGHYSYSLVLYITVAILAVSVFMQYENFTNEVTYTTSKVDGKNYLVRNMPDRQEAADLLAEIRARCVKLVNYVHKKYPEDKSVERLYTKFRPNNITESSKTSKYTSYSINKGEKIVFCMRSRDDQEKLVEPNVMMFVAIHELAHVMSKSVGHTEEFWDNMRFLLKQGIEVGVYKHQDFRKKPVKYCGTEITDTPLND